MVRAGVVGLGVAALGCLPAVCAAEPIRAHPSFSVGVTVGTATEKVECSTLGKFVCPLPRERERGLGVQAAPHFEALVMIGSRTGFRFGVGLRYLPGFGLDTGRELHFAVVPEVIGHLAGARYVFAHFFNSVGSGSPPSVIRERQRPVLAACATLEGVEDASCSSWRSNLTWSLGIEVGLLDRFEGFGLRYGLGLQGIVQQAHAVADGYSGDDPELSDDDLYATYLIDGGRGVAFVGVEW